MVWMVGTKPMWQQRCFSAFYVTNQDGWFQNGEKRCGADSLNLDRSDVLFVGFDPGRSNKFPTNVEIYRGAVFSVDKCMVQGDGVGAVSGVNLFNIRNKFGVGFERMHYLDVHTR